MNSRDLGAHAEDLAIEYLMARDLKFLRRNYNSHYSEIDLIMSDSTDLVFVEVKGSYYAFDPMQNLTAAKILKLTRGITAYLDQNPYSGDYRLDFVGVSITASSIEIEWIPDIEIML